MRSMAVSARLQRALREHQPASLIWRVVWVVLGGYAAIFVLLMVWIGYTSLGRESGELDRGVLSLSRGLLKGLEDLDSEVGARAALAFFRATSTSDLSGQPELDLAIMRLDGTLHLTGKLAPQLDLRELPNGVAERSVDQRKLRLYVTSGKKWKVAVIDEADTRDAWALRELALELAMYVAAAVPIVLVPVLLTLRAALGPLRRLSEQLARRSLQDSRPLAATNAYRELLPLEASLNRLFERIGIGLAREKAFVNDAAHELRTPLAVISTQAHLLAASEGVAREEARVRLQSAIERASHLTQQLLRLAQADSMTGVTRQQVDVMNVARDALAGFAAQAAAQRSELALEGPDNLVLESDRQGLRSIFENLIDNALRYGGRGVQVEVRVFSPADSQPAQWQLWVADNGPGIPAAQRERVFERFWRAQQDHSRGAGLGLAIVREVARSLGGDARIEEGLQGKGCAVVVTLR